MDVQSCGPDLHNWTKISQLQGGMYMCTKCGVFTLPIELQNAMEKAIDKIMEDKDNV